MELSPDLTALQRLREVDDYPHPAAVLQVVLEELRAAAPGVAWTARWSSNREDRLVVVLLTPGAPVLFSPELGEGAILIRVSRLRSFATTIRPAIIVEHGERGLLIGEEIANTTRHGAEPPLEKLRQRWREVAPTWAQPIVALEAWAHQCRSRVLTTHRHGYRYLGDLRGVEAIAAQTYTYALSAFQAQADLNFWRFVLIVVVAQAQRSPIGELPESQDRVRAVVSEILEGAA
jgi:hypothetical protein